MVGVCEAVTNIGGDSIRCAQEARPGGCCYYHSKMRRGLIQPDDRAESVVADGVRIHQRVKSR